MPAPPAALAVAAGASAASAAVRFGAAILGGADRAAILSFSAAAAGTPAPATAAVAYGATAAVPALTAEPPKKRPRTGAA